LSDDARVANTGLSEKRQLCAGLYESIARFEGERYQEACAIGVGPVEFQGAAVRFCHQFGEIQPEPAVARILPGDRHRQIPSEPPCRHE